MFMRLKNKHTLEPLSDTEVNFHIRWSKWGVGMKVTDPGL